MKRASQIVLLALSIGLLMGSDSQAVRYEKLGSKIGRASCRERV